MVFQFDKTVFVLKVERLFLLLGAVDKKDTLKVIKLVLDDAGGKVFEGFGVGDEGMGLGVDGLVTEDDGLMAENGSVDFGNGKAAF